MDGQQQPGRQDRAWDEKTRALVACLEALLELHRERLRLDAALSRRHAAANDGATLAPAVGGPEFMPARPGSIAGALQQE